MQGQSVPVHRPSVDSQKPLLGPFLVEKQRYQLVNLLRIGFDLRGHIGEGLQLCPEIFRSLSRQRFRVPPRLALRIRGQELAYPPLEQRAH